MICRRIELLPKNFILSLSLFLFLLAIPVLALKTPQGDTCFVYPSPVSGDTAWAVYNMPSNGTALVIVYNEAGDMVSQVQEIKSAGVQQTGLDLFYYRKGIYLCRIVLTLDSGEKKRLKPFKFMVLR